MINLREKIAENKTINKIYTAYNNLADKINFPTKHSKISIAVFIVITLAAFFISVNSRYEQLRTYNTDKYKPYYYSGETPIMSTLDAYKFIRHAKENREGIYDPSKPDPQIFYPDGSPYPNPLPLLSFALDHLSRLTGQDMYVTAVNMIPWLSSFFILAVAIYFYLAGYPAAGVAAGLITSFAPIFYGRTSMGRFDTDGLNMFFLFTASIFLLLASRSKTNIKQYIYSALLGITVFLFYRFYHHGMFNIMYLVMLFICLYIANVRMKNILISLLIYIVFSNPLYLYWAVSQLQHAVYVYIFNEKTGIQAVFPNVYDTISEARRESFIDVLKGVIGNPVISVTGLIGIVLFALFNIRNAMPLIPIAVLGLMAFVSAGRFAMYLSPAVGAGLAYLLYVLTGYAVKIAKNINDKVLSYIKIFVPAVLTVLMLFIVVAKGYTSYGRINSASIHPKIYDMFKEMKEKLPENSAIYTWWDYGLAITDATGFPVFHSGMTQETAKTWIIAFSMVSNQDVLYNTASYLDNFGIKEVEQMAENGATLEDIKSKIVNFDKGPKNKNTYILYTEDMVDKYVALAFLAKGKQEVIYKNYCTLHPAQQSVLQCENSLIDLNSNKIKFQNGEAAISKIDMLDEKGKIVHSQTLSYLNDGLNVIVEPIDKGVVRAYILPPETYNSAFVQMFILGSYNKEYFEPVMDNYPYGRLYLLKSKEN